MILFLNGYRGSGKSTIAPLVASRIGCPFVDTDDLIVAKAGKAISEIFASEGEPAFRRMETSVISGLVANDDASESTETDESPISIVVSLGGGAIMTAENQSMISSGKTVFLNAPAEVLWARIKGDDSSRTQRPDLTEEGGLAEVRSVLGRRLSTYIDCADYSIDTTELSPEEIADAIARWATGVDKPPDALNN
ncbi:MAG: shikimate kinase [Planctomycetota bacterium]